MVLRDEGFVKLGAIFPQIIWVCLMYIQLTTRSGMKSLSQMAHTRLRIFTYLASFGLYKMLCGNFFGLRLSLCCVFENCFICFLIHCKLSCFCFRRGIERTRMHTTDWLADPSFSQKNQKSWWRKSVRECPTTSTCNSHKWLLLYLFPPLFAKFPTAENKLLKQWQPGHLTAVLHSADTKWDVSQKKSFKDRFCTTLGLFPWMEVEQGGSAWNTAKSAPPPTHASFLSPDAWKIPQTFLGGFVSKGGKQNLDKNMAWQEFHRVWANFHAVYRL